MFEIQLGQLPVLCSAHTFRESELVFIEYMNGTSQNGEPCKILNHFIIFHLLELSKGRHFLFGIMVEFDQC